MILGIDPGATGAFALLTADRRYVLTVEDLPVLTMPDGKRRMHAADLHRRLGALLRECRRTEGTDSVVAYLENVRAMPGRDGKGGRQAMGATSAFNFGRGLGVIEAVLACLAIPVIYTDPVAWKRRAGLLKSEKDAARQLAIAKYRHAETFLARKKDIGRADAILIAAYGAAA